MQKLILIDGNSLLNRAFYATPPFLTSYGLPTNAILGFTRLILKIIEDENPEYFLVAFDKKAPTFRHKLFDGYKAQRKGMPPELASQLEPLKELLLAMKIATYEQEGIEADDIYGTLSKMFDVHSKIFTGDRDSYQLVDENTDICFTQKGVSDLLVLTNDNFFEKIGLYPKQIIDKKALMGDSSDYYPGVAGIGEKGAIKLLTSYGDIEGIYEHIGELSGALKNKLVSGKDDAFLSKTIATIRRDCEINLSLDELICPKKFGEDAREILKKLEMKSLLAQHIFQADKQKIWVPEVVTITREKDLPELDGTIFANFSSGMFEFFDGKKVYEVEANANLFGEVDECYAKVVKKVFKNKVVLFDAKYAMHELFKLDDSTQFDFEDLSLQLYICDGETKELSKIMAERSLDVPSSYAVKILYNECQTKLDGNLKDLYFNIEKPLLSVLFQMEVQGVPVDYNVLCLLEDEFSQKAQEYAEKIYSIAGCTFNINSSVQLADILFTKLGIKSNKKTKGGKLSTDADVLEELAENYEIARYVQKYRTYSKLISTYLAGFKPLIVDGRVHTTYNQTQTQTGRLSSVSPNMQNLPVRDDEGREIRKMFKLDGGSVFLEADYSQIELRLLAHFSKCQKLIDAYKNGVDIHALTASEVYNIPLEKVTSNDRRNAKAVNFGIIYGISEFGLAKQLGIRPYLAKEIITNYFKSYPEVKAYMDANVEYAKQNGYVVTLLGRRRYIPELKSTNYNIRSFGERAAMNMPLQGTSADIIKIAMVKVSDALKKSGLNTKIIMQVHDELVLEAPVHEVEKAQTILKECMEGAAELLVPLFAEVHLGFNLYDAK